MEERLSTENARFSGERTEMQDTIRSLQHAQRLNETSVNDSRRRLEDHLARIDRQLCVFFDFRRVPGVCFVGSYMRSVDSDETRSRLSQEVEANRQLQVKSDLDTRTSQRKVDQLVSCSFCRFSCLLQETHKWIWLDPRTVIEERSSFFCSVDSATPRAAHHRPWCCYCC